MRIAILGAYGQLGTALQSELQGEICALRHADAELTDAESVTAAISSAAPDAVINAAAYNLVDRAEDEPQTAFSVNALGPRNVALACSARDIPLVHVSTDYVFSGNGEPEHPQTPRTVPYTEADPPDPQNAYAVSKLAGEHFVRNIARRHFVVRTCGLYGKVRTGGKGNFVETMLRLAAQRGELRVVNDQECTPTSATDLARAIAALIQTDSYGLYHATNAGSATWYRFACEIFRIARISVKVTPIATGEFGARAKRPSYSVLATSKLSATTGIVLPPWEEALARYLAHRGDIGPASD
jgi:dTDP-4-dehydrorhamnose reductase